METLTTTIKRRWLKEIVAGTKKIEYREIKPYWIKRLIVGESAFAQAFKRCPFKLRLINGMSKDAPEVTVLIKKIDFGYQPWELDPTLSEDRLFRLHIAKVLSYKNWNRKRGIPA